MEVGLSPGDFVLDGDPPSHVYCGQTDALIKKPLGTEVGLGLRDIVLDGDPAPPLLKGHSPPIFGQCPLWPNGRTKMLLGSEVGLGPGDCVRWGSSYHRHTHSTQFLVHVYFGQTAEWIRMPLGTEANLGPGNIVLGGVAAPP